MGEDPAFAGPFGCCIQEVLLCCHPVLREECIAARLSLVQRLESVLHILSTATDGTGRHGNQDIRQAQLDSHVQHVSVVNQTAVVEVLSQHSWLSRPV